jgi:hypothetical protein
VAVLEVVILPIKPIGKDQLEQRAVSNTLILKRKVAKAVLLINPNEGILPG